MSAAELSVWEDWAAVYGFPDERAEFGRAIAGAYAGAVWGGKATPTDLLPKIGGPTVRPTSVADVDAVKAWFDARGK